VVNNPFPNRKKHQNYGITETKTADYGEKSDNCAVNEPQEKNNLRVNGNRAIDFRR
jgi:hypothetical protein